jgi:hypothetical protein
LKEYITSYYKDLFGPPKLSSFSLDESQVEDIDQVSQEENNLLAIPFTMDEARGPFFKWNTKKLRGQMDSQQNFINHVGRLLKMTSWLSFGNFIMDIYPSIA